MDNVCIFKTGVSATNMQAVTGADSAIGILPNPPPTSGCSSLGTGKIELVQAKNFNLQCGQIFSGNDVEQQFQPTFDACLNACAGLSTCGGISFDATQSQGFKNCYLKASVSSGGLLAKAGVDSAIVAVDNSAPASASSSAAAPLGGGGTGGTETSAPVAAPAAADTNGPAASNSALMVTTTVSGAGAAVAQETTPTATAVASAASAAEVAAGGSSPSSSNAWIAAPVIGGLAAFTLVLAIFILWGRRRVRGGGRGLPFGDGIRRLGDVVAVGGGVRHGAGEKYMTDEESGGGSGTSSSSSSAPGSRRGDGGGGGIKVLSGSGRRVGHETLTSGTGPGLEGLDVGVAVSSDGGNSGSAARGTRANHTPHGSGGSSRKAGLRDSQNGLRLNGLSIHGTGTELAPGIPQTFAGPEIGRAS
jgi:hypothetical protein